MKACSSRDNDAGKQRNVGMEVKRPISPHRMRSFRMFLAAFVIVTSGTAAFLVLEIKTRAQMLRIDSNRLAFEERRMNAFRTEMFDASFWAEPWWRYRSNLSVDVVKDGTHFQIETNSLGWRSPEVAIPKPADEFRIVCIGGSTTVEGWTNDATYPAILQRLLASHFRTTKISVVNGGLSGLNSWGENRKAQDYLALEPDLIIEYNGVNDIAWRIFPLLSSEIGPVQRIMRKSILVNHRLNSWLLPSRESIDRAFDIEIFCHLAPLARRLRKEEIPLAFCSFAYPEPGGLNEEERTFFEFNVKEWGGGDFTLETYVALVRKYNDRLREFTSDRGLHYVPLAERFNGRAEDFLDCCHMRSKGIEKKARLISEYMQEQLPPLLAVKGIGPLPQHHQPDK